MAKGKSRRYARFIAGCMMHAMAVTALTALLSYCLIYDMFPLSKLSSIDKNTDFELSDIYNAVAENRAVATQVHDIVIVSVDGCSRERIAQIIEAIDFLEPKAIGLDILFTYPNPNDTYLIAVLESCDRLVLPIHLKDNEPVGSYFYDRLDNAHYGAINLGAATSRDIIRDFKPFWNINNSTIGGLSAELVRIVDTTAFERLCRRGKETETIYYPSTAIPVVEAAEILLPDGTIQQNAKAKIIGRTVIVGNIYDLSDEHLTPIGVMSGPHIHAHILHTILHDKYIESRPRNGRLVLALIICFCLMAIGVALKKRNNHAESVIMRILQIGMIFLLLWYGCSQFSNYGFYMDFAPILTMTAAGMIILDIYMGSYAALVWIIRTYKNSKNQQMKKFILSAVIILSALTSYGQNRYAVYNVSGNIVLRKYDSQEWISAEKHLPIALSDYVNISDGGYLSIIDNSTNHVYRSLEVGTMRVKNIIDRANEQSTQTFNLLRARMADKTTTTNNSFSVAGVTVRGEVMAEDDFDDKVYSTICEIVDLFSERHLLSSKVLTATRKFTDNGFVFVISNNGQTDYNVNILKITDNCKTATLCLDNASARGSIIIPAGLTLELPIFFSNDAEGVYVVFGLQQDVDFNVSAVQIMLNNALPPRSESLPAIVTTLE